MWNRIKMGLLALFIVGSLLLSCSGVWSCGSPMAEAYGGVCTER